MNMPRPDHDAASVTAMTGGIAASHLASIAHAWGYACGVRELAQATPPGPPAAAPAPSEALLAHGMLATHQLPSGLRMCVSDMTTIVDNRRTGILDRSLTIMLALEGTPHRYEAAGREEMIVDCGRALVITSPETTALSGLFRAGDRTRYLVLQAHADALCDPDLAEMVERHLDQHRFMPLHHGVRVCDLARSCFPAAMAGPIGRLRAESCALELLALALESFEAPPPSFSLSAREVERICQVRDELVASLDKEHRLEDIARSAGMSASAFKVKFAAVVGQPVFRFLREKRLERAWDGLTHEGWSVSQAAFYVGYRHPANFATAFRRRFGVAPRDVGGSGRES